MKNINILIKAIILSYKKRSLAVWLWACNFIFSLFTIGPLFFLIIDHTAHSFSGKNALQKLDVLWLGDFINRFMNFTPAFLGLLLLAMGSYFILSIFLNGGIIGSLNSPDSKTTLAGFFHDCGLYFWRFFRLFIISIPVYLAILGISYSLIKPLLKFFDRRAASEWPVLIVRNLRILVLVLLLTVATMLIDYIKIGLVTSGSKKVLRETRLTLRFIGKRFFKAWGLYLLAGLVFVILTFFHLEIARLLPKNRSLLVLLVFLWQQFYILCRQASKLLFYASALELTRQYREPIQN